MTNVKKYPEVSQGFGDRLRQARLSKGFAKQKQLAQAVGIDSVTVSRHERDAYAPQPDVLLAYCRVLGVTEQWLRFGDEAGAPNPHAELIERYLLSNWGMTTAPEVAQQLRAVRFAALGIRIVTQDVIHDVRNLLDRYLQAR